MTSEQEIQELEKQKLELENYRIKEALFTKDSKKMKEYFNWSQDEVEDFVAPAYSEDDEADLPPRPQVMVDDEYEGPGEIEPDMDEDDVIEDENGDGIDDRFEGTPVVRDTIKDVVTTDPTEEYPTEDEWEYHRGNYEGYDLRNDEVIREYYQDLVRENPNYRRMKDLILKCKTVTEAQIIVMKYSAELVENIPSPYGRRHGLTPEKKKMNEEVKKQYEPNLGNLGHKGWV